MLRALSTVANAVASWVGAITRGFDIRDVFVFGGLGLLGYGLYLHRPWIAFAVCGGLLMLIGYAMRSR